jgi:hypothetical protein
MTEISASLPATQNRSSRIGQRPAVAPTMRSMEEQKKYHARHSRGWKAWWPVCVGLALGVLSPWLRDLLAPFEPWGMRAVFPFVLLAGRHEIGLSDELTRTLPQLMLYLQFPLEGLFTKLTFSRGLKITGAIGQLFFLHAISALVLWQISSALQ